MNLRRDIPLCVDLDGTLIYKDTTLDCSILLFRKNPLNLFLMAFWILQGRARFKEEIAKRVMSDVHKLPYNKVMLNIIQEARAVGQKVCLVTATDQRIANTIADSLKIFDQVLASNGIINLRAEKKAQCLVQEFGAGGFIYAGNSGDDLYVWAYAAQGIVVTSNPTLVQRAQRICNHIFWLNSRTLEVKEMVQ